MTKTNEVPANLRAEPMTYRVEHVANFHHQRAVLAENAEGMTVEELREAAVAAQIDVGGAKTKEELVEAVRTQARGVNSTVEG